MALLLTLIFSAPPLTFLNLFPGAEATALAGCVTTLTDNPTVCYYNPANLAFLDGDNLSVTHSHLLPKFKDLPGSFHEYFGFTTPLSSRWHLGVSGLLFIRGETEIFTSEREKLGFDTDIVLTLSYKLSNLCALGISPKYIYSLNLKEGMEAKDWTVAFDLGIIYKLLPQLAIASVVQNIGEDIHYNIGNESRTLPRRLKLGLKIEPFATKAFEFFFTPEVIKSFGSASWGKGVGAELGWRTILFLRGGLFNDEFRSGFTYGGGFRYKRLNVSVGTDERLFKNQRLYWKFTLFFRS